MNLNEQLTQSIADAAAMTLSQVEEALENGRERTVGELTALSLAKKAAEGGMDAIKLMRDLCKTETVSELPVVELRVISPDGT